MENVLHKIVGSISHASDPSSRKKWQDSLDWTRNHKQRLAAKRVNIENVLDFSPDNRPIIDELYNLVELYPIGDINVACLDMPDNDQGYAMTAASRSGHQVLIFDWARWSTPGVVQDLYRKDFQKRFHTSSNFRQIVWHEYGHMVKNRLFGIERENALFERLRASTPVSDYARENIDEWFAETFASFKYGSDDAKDHPDVHLLKRMIDGRLRATQKEAA